MKFLKRDSMDSKRIILVTGANRGIGFEICRQLAEMDQHVILTARNEEKGKAASAKLNGEVDFLRLDMTAPETFAEARRIIEEKYGKLDVLINNAGISKGSKGFDQAAMEDIRFVMETNLFGPVALIKTLLPLLLKSDDSRIINISSGMGAINDAGSGYAAYRLSKASLNAFSAFLAKDLSGTHIKVNAVCPGWVRTDMGGPLALRSVAKGAETAVWLATATSIPNGKFVRDQKVINW